MAVIVELPEALAAEAVGLGLGEHRRRRRGAGDAMTFVIGVGGSLVSLMQAPSTIPEFARWLIMATRRDDVLLTVRRRPNDEVIVNVSASMDADVAVKALAAALQGRKQPAE